MSSTADDIRASMTALETGQPVTPSEPAAPAPVEPSAPPSTPPRGPDGRFQQASGGPDAGPGAPPPGPATPAPPSPVAAPPGPDGAAPGALGGGQPAGGAVALDHTKPPSAWTPEMKAKWNAIPEDIRKEVTRREEASARGVQQLKQHYEPMEAVYKAIEPYGAYFQHIQRHPIDYLQEVISIEQTMTLGNPAQKVQMILGLADRYGVPMRQALDSAMGGKLNAMIQQAHQQWGTPAEIPPEVARELYELRQSQENIVTQAVDAELNQFLADGSRPFFDQVKDRMADLIEQGVCEGFDDAYDMAVYLDPNTRQQAMAQQNGQRQLSGVAARQAAAAQISTPSPASIQSGQAPGEESIEDTVRKAWNQQATGGV